MNDTVKVGDYVYLRIKNGSDFDFSKKYKVACIRKEHCDIIIEYPTGWSPSMMDIDFLNLKPDKTYWYTSKWLICSHGFIIDNE